ncbi:hypothetical protein THAOC_07025, partial [Thalassiosira oceanica]
MVIQRGDADQGGKLGNGGRSGFGQALQAGDREKGAFGAGGETQALHPEFDKLFAPLTNATVGNVCQAAGLNLRDLPYLYAAGGSGEDMCYHHLFGECRRQRCRRYHATKKDLDTWPGFVTTLCKRLQPGVQKLVKSQGSRKRAPAESDDRISRREENNIDVTKRVKFANKTTAMFNAAGKIKSGVNDYETTTRRRSDEKRLEERGGVYTRANSRGGESVKPVA